MVNQVTFNRYGRRIFKFTVQYELLSHEHEKFFTVRKIMIAYTTDAASLSEYAAENNFTFRRGMM